MQPIDQMSIAFVYSDALSMISGARYQRVTTYLFSELGFDLVFRLKSAAETEIAELYIALLVQQNIRRFEVPVDNVRRVHVIRRPENLVHEVLNVLVAELLLRVNDSVQVGFHEVSDDVDVSVSFRVLRFEDLKQANYVVVVEKLQKSNFAIYALGVDEIFEGVRDFLDRYLLVGLRVETRGNDPVRAAAHHFEELVAPIDFELGVL